MRLLALYLPCLLIRLSISWLVAEDILPGAAFRPGFVSPFLSEAVSIGLASRRLAKVVFGPDWVVAGGGPAL